MKDYSKKVSKNKVCINLTLKNVFQLLKDFTSSLEMRKNDAISIDLNLNKHKCIQEISAKKSCEIKCISKILLKLLKGT